MLLNKNNKTRLGAKGIEEIKNHSFLSSINWNELKKYEKTSSITIVPISSQQEHFDEVAPLSNTPDDYLPTNKFNFSNFHFEDFSSLVCQNQQLMELA